MVRRKIADRDTTSEAGMSGSSDLRVQTERSEIMRLQSFKFFSNARATNPG
jgi:hypothetical protein